MLEEIKYLIKNNLFKLIVYLLVLVNFVNIPNYILLRFVEIYLNNKFGNCFVDLNSSRIRNLCKSLLLIKNFLIPKIKMIFKE